MSLLTSFFVNGFIAVACRAAGFDRGAVSASTDVASTANPEGDQLWLVSCRNASYSSREDALAGLAYSVFRRGAGWTAADGPRFERSTSGVQTTCLLVLGNGYTAADTRTIGQTLYKRLAAGLPADADVRFVIWSWPSDHADAGPVKDLRIKAARTTNVAWRLANWMDEIPSDHLSLLGTSFGARIVMEALELRGGGQLSNLRLERPLGPARDKVRVVLISAAIDNDWLMPGRRLASAVTQIDRLLLVNNSSDSLLKRYHWLYGRRSKAAALGSTGLRSLEPLGELGDSLEQIDAAPIIGRRHGCAPYFESPRLLAEMRSVLFGDRSPSPNPPTDGLRIPVASTSDR